MKKILALATAGLLAIAGLAYAQSNIPARTVPTAPLVTTLAPTDDVQIIPGGAAGVGNVYASLLQLRAFILQQNATAGTPVLTTTTTICGGTTAVILGSNYAFRVTEGTTASTSCVVTFNPAFVTAPVCQANLNNVVDAAFKIAVTNTTLTATQTSASSNVLNVICMGQPGG
jgi:hypothetical protein